MPVKIREDIHRLLKKYWGYDAFRPLQEEIVLAVLKGQDVLALLPTGGGKSLCFQVPGLQLGGTTLVISPLVSLMNDQVAQLRRRHLSAVAITSAMNFRQMEIALQNAALGHVQFLYCSPERLQNDDFLQKLSHLPITLIAVDEAHCISQWGYDFRPSYLQIARVRSYFPQCPLIALTASATEEVAIDIQEKLAFQNKAVFRQSFARANLRYIVQHEENKFDRLLKVINNVAGSGVIYVRNRKRTKEIADWLNQKGITAGFYHAGMTYEERELTQQLWIAGKTRIISATNAFGMGIDKPDVRFVVHLDLPESPEAYFQEAGRGGRDGLISWAVLLYDESDVKQLEEHFKNSFPEQEYIRKVYQAICNFFQIAVGAGEGTVVTFDIEQICKNYNLQALQVFNSLKFLEKSGYVALIDTGYESPKVMMLAGKETIYDFELRNPNLEPLIKTLLRSYGGLFEQYVPINFKDLALRVKTTVAEIEKKLKLLDQAQVLSYLPATELPKLYFQHPRVNAKDVWLDHQVYERLKQAQLNRIEAMQRYVQSRQCRQLQLLHYFSESQALPCGHCDVCIEEKRKERPALKNLLLETLSDQPSTIDELRKAMYAYNDANWIQTLNVLTDDGIVMEDQGKYWLSPNYKHEINPSRD